VQEKKEKGGGNDNKEQKEKKQQQKDAALMKLTPPQPDDMGTASLQSKPNDGKAVTAGDSDSGESADVVAVAAVAAVTAAAAVLGLLVLRPHVLPLTFKRLLVLTTTNNAGVTPRFATTDPPFTASCIYIYYMYMYPCHKAGGAKCGTCFCEDCKPKGNALTKSIPALVTMCEDPTNYCSKWVCECVKRKPKPPPLPGLSAPKPPQLPKPPKPDMMPMPMMMAALMKAMVPTIVRHRYCV